MNLEEARRRAAAAAGAETRLFEVLGGWAPSVAETPVKLMLDRHSGHAAWRARQWEDRLAGVDLPGLRVPDPEVLAGAFSEMEKAASTVGRLAGAYRFALPRLASAYRRCRSAAAPTADGSMLWALDLVEVDLARDWQEGEAALQELLDRPEAVDEAAAALATLERRLTGQNVRCG